MSANVDEYIYKGWLQTWLVHMRRPGLLWKELGPAGFLTAQAVMLGILVSALAHPFFLAWTLWRFATGSFFPPPGHVLSLVMTTLSLAVLVAGYGVSMFAAVVALRKRRLVRLWPTALSLPVYWLLISAGGWLALWQFVRRPFHWNKTRHGLTRLRL